MKKRTQICITLAFVVFYQMALCQKPITHILLDPMRLNKQAFNVGLQTQMHELSQVALYGTFGQQTKNLSTETANRLAEIKTQAFEIRFFPFQKADSYRRKGKKSGCDVACFGGNSKATDAPILRGLYIAPGMLFETMALDSTTNMTPDAAPSKSLLTAKTRAYTVAFGYQLQVSAFTFGMSYQVAFRKTNLEGNYDMLKNTTIAEQMQPNRTNLGNTLRLEVGIHF
jgi:hypothetical protein